MPTNLIYRDTSFSPRYITIVLTEPSLEIVVFRVSLKTNFGLSHTERQNKKVYVILNLVRNDIIPSPRERARVRGALLEILNSKKIMCSYFTQIF